MSFCPMDLPEISEIKSFWTLQVCSNTIPRNSSCLEWLQGLRSRYLARGNPVFNSLSIKCPPKILFMHITVHLRVHSSVLQLSSQDLGTLLQVQVGFLKLQAGLPCMQAVSMGSSDV